MLTDFDFSSLPRKRALLASFHDPIARGEQFAMRVPGSGAAATSTRRSPPVARARPRVDARAAVGAGVHPGTRGCVGGARKNPRVVRWAPIVRPNDARVRRAEDLGRGRLSRVAARAGETDARSSPDDPSDDRFPDARSEGAGQTRSTDREDAIGTLGTDPMYADEWTAGGYSSDTRDVVDARRRRDRDRMLYMSPIRAKMTPAVMDDDDADVSDGESNATNDAKRSASLEKKNSDGGANLLSTSTRPGRDPGAAARFAISSTVDASYRTSTSLLGVFGRDELREVFRLAVPALGSLLADPLMSLIDTAAVGRHGSTSLAALGPNTAVFQIVFQLFSFLSITTTGMVARACADGDGETARRALANATILALVFGSFTCLGLNVFAEQVLRLMGCGPDLVSAATPYLRIRAFAIPAVLFSTSAQGGCLGQQDAQTPLRIFLVAGATNAALDVFCVGRGVFGYGLNLGVAGAAYATLAAQYLSAFLFFLVLSNRRMLPREWKRWRLPSNAELRQITGISGMLLLGSLCRMGVYTMMTTTALRLGTLVMAAHQVALQIFWTLTYFVDPLFVAATSFVARDFGRRPTRVRRMSALLMGLSLVIGAAIATLSFCVSSFGAGAFTNDVTVLASIKSVAPLMGAAQLVSALVLVTEGVLIGCGDLRYLLDVHCLNFVVLGGVLWWVGSTNGGLQGIWVAVFMNQALRMAQHAAHVWRGGGPDLFARNADGRVDGDGDGI
jgi:putative MATE family efflux protein